MAMPAAIECPDPHKPDPISDVDLRELEKALVVRLMRSVADDVRNGAADRAIREYVGHLHAAGCPPEHVVIRVKRLVLRATRRMTDRGDATALCEALVLRTIEIYFDR